ncbi:MAG: hypothetical protein NW215_10695 [Hyphomicrobiales bacterium]|nr:hypothetical protein [Hyphomicrobiales bacterium]
MQITSYSMPVTRATLLACGAGGLAFSGLAAALNGYAQGGGDHLAGVVIAVAFVAAAGAGALFPHLTGAALARKAWGDAVIFGAASALCGLFVFLNAAGFVAQHRGEGVRGKTDAIGAFERAEADLAAARADLAAQKASPLWAASSACGAPKGETQRRLCAKAATLEAKIETASANLDRGRPASSDAHAELVAWATGAPAETVGKALPLYTGVFAELLAALCFFAAGKLSWGTAPLTRNPVAAVEKQTVADLAAVELAAVGVAVEQPRIAAPPPMIGFDGQPVDVRPKRRRKLHS